MKMTAVQGSSTITAIGYDPEQRILQVAFRTGAEYIYYNMAQEMFDLFLSSESKGIFFARHIKGVYEYVQVR